MMKDISFLWASYGIPAVSILEDINGVIQRDLPLAVHMTFNPHKEHCVGGH